MPFADRFKSFSDYFSGRQVSGPVYRLVIEITNVCNLKCVMCPRNTMTRKVGHMDPDLFVSIIRENRKTLEFVSLNGYGEPLLSPDLPVFLRLCQENSVPTGISTNCTVLNDERTNRLLEHPPDIVILALDGISQESYEKVRKGARFEEVLSNVTNFLKKCTKIRKKPFIILQCIYMTETTDQIRDFKKFFSGYEFDAIRIRQLTFSGRDRTDADYANKSCSCYWLWTEPMILQDGTLVPCCQDVNGRLALGNLGEHSLKELWNKGRIEKLRNRHALGKRDAINVCRDCNMYQPGPLFSLGAAFFNTVRTNRLLPRIETVISHYRYRN